MSVGWGACHGKPAQDATKAPAGYQQPPGHISWATDQDLAEPLHPTSHEMTVALLDALGMHSGARPETPQQVWEMALTAVRERTGEAKVERAAVVAWLRGRGVLADDIVRGDHRR